MADGALGEEIPFLFSFGVDTCHDKTPPSVVRIMCLLLLNPSRLWSQQQSPSPSPDPLGHRGYT